MAWVVIILIAAAAIWLARKGKPAPEPEPKAIPRRRRPYADRCRNGKFEDLSADDVRLVFHPFSARLPQWKRDARPLIAAGEKASETGVFDAAALTRAKTLHRRITAEIRLFENEFDEISFEADEPPKRYTAIEETLSEIEDDLSRAIDNMQWARDHPDEWE